MGHPGDSYVLRAGKNKDILLDIPTGQGGQSHPEITRRRPSPLRRPAYKRMTTRVETRPPCWSCFPQGGLLLLPSRFARSFGSRGKKFCSKVKGIGFLLHI